MECKHCGSDDWYVKGKYKRCIPCHANNQRKTYHARKAGTYYQRTHKYQAKPLAESIKVLSGKHLKTACHRGHEYTQENTRLEITSKGQIVRRCIKCIYLKSVRRYGNKVDSYAAKMLSSNSPLDRLAEIE